jgi:hypothetical protein
MEATVSITAGLVTGRRPITSVSLPAHPSCERRTHSIISWNTCLTWVLACCAVGACKAVETTMPLQATLGGHVEYSMSGGLSGIRQSLTIHDSGLVEARNDKRGKTALGQLDPTHLAELRAAFNKINANPETIPQRLDARCADCFQHTIRAIIGGKHHRVDVNSMALQASPYGEIVRFLSQILRETLFRKSITNE